MAEQTTVRGTVLTGFKLDAAQMQASLRELGALSKATGIPMDQLSGQIVKAAKAGDTMTVALAKTKAEIKASGEAAAGGKLRWHELTTGMQAAFGIMSQGARIVQSAVGELVTMARRGSELADIEANLAFSIDRATEATKGFVTQADLAKSAVRLTATGVAISAEQYATLTEATAKLADAQGRDIPQSIAQMVDALAKGTERGVKELGILIDRKAALQIYAQALGVSVKALSEFGERQAIVNAVLEESAKINARLKLETDGAGEAVDRLSVAWTNASDATAQWLNRQGWLAERLEGFAESMRDPEASVRAFVNRQREAAGMAPLVAEGVGLQTQAFRFLAGAIGDARDRLRQWATEAETQRRSIRGQGEEAGGARAGAPARFFDPSAAARETRDRRIIDAQRVHEDELTRLMRDASAQRREDVRSGFEAEIRAREDANARGLDRAQAYSAALADARLIPLRAQLAQEQAMWGRLDGMLDAATESMVRGFATAAVAAVAGAADFGTAMSDMLKVTIRTLAAEALVQAMMETARGLAALAMGLPSAAIHFKSAAVFGALAGGALLATAGAGLTSGEAGRGGGIVGGGAGGAGGFTPAVTGGGAPATFTPIAPPGAGAIMAPTVTPGLVGMAGQMESVALAITTGIVLGMREMGAQLARGDRDDFRAGEALRGVISAYTRQTGGVGTVSVGGVRVLKAR